LSPFHGNLYCALTLPFSLGLRTPLPLQVGVLNFAGASVAVTFRGKKIKYLTH